MNTRNKQGNNTQKITKGLIAKGNSQKINFFMKEEVTNAKRFFPVMPPVNKIKTVARIFSLKSY